MATKTAMSLAEFTTLGEDTHYELDRGELITMAPVQPNHTLLVGHLFKTLLTAVDGLDLDILFEPDCLIEKDPPTVREPDLAIATNEMIAASKDESLFQGAPLLAIEVISPSERPGPLNRKIQQYLEAGCRTVWTVYPDQREIHRFTPTSTQILTAGDAITEPDILATWSSPVANLLP